ncbi:MAG: hypothetical protein AB4042_02565 [Leptolyngbyaceae cyanobacterium]
MKRTRRGLMFALPLFLISCRQPAFVFAPLPSPSGQYFVDVTVNQSNTDPATYLCLVLHLLDGQRQERSRLQTTASNRMKWAIGWMPDPDIVVLYSSDIGTTAWSVSTGDFEAMTVSPAIRRWGEQLKSDKYGNGN